MAVLPRPLPVGLKFFQKKWNFAVKLPSISVAALALTLVSAPLFAHAGHNRNQRTGSAHIGRQQPAQAQTQGNAGAKGRGRTAQVQATHYYNGQWVDATEWQSHTSERNRWVEQNRQRSGTHYQSEPSSLLTGIIGFALGAGIAGSQAQAQNAQSAGDSWDERCAAKYRTYDRNSRTYLGYDGARHYCQ